MDYLAAVLDDDGRDFVPTTELIEALQLDDPTAFGRQMGELGCRSARDRVSTADSAVRQVRGYYTTDLRAATDTHTGATKGRPRG